MKKIIESWPQVAIGLLIAMFFAAFPLSAILGTIYVKHLIYAIAFLWLLVCCSKYIFKLIKNGTKEYLRPLYLLYFIILIIYSVSVVLLKESNVIDYAGKLTSFILIGLLLISSSELKSPSLTFFEVYLYIIIFIYCFFIHIDFARIYAGSGNYLTATLPIGAAFIMSFIRSFDGEIKLWLRLLSFVSAVFFLQSMTLFMGRGSFLICIFLAIIYLLLVSLSLKKAPFLIFSLIVIFGLGVYYQDEFLQSSLYSRLSVLADGDVGERSNTYGILFNSLSFDTVMSGFGFGISGIYIYDLERYYPHNIHLHFLTDLGIIGFIFSLIYPFIITLAIYQAIKKNSAQLTVFLFLNIYIYMNFLKSFSMFDSWWLSITSGFLIAVIKKEKNANI